VAQPRVQPDPPVRAVYLAIVGGGGPVNLVSLGVMKTYPHIRLDGTIGYFEISNSFPWSLGFMRRVLQSVKGVSGVRRNWFNDDRWSFLFQERSCVVNEPYGSRYWIGPIEKEPPLDMAPIHEAFGRFRFLGTFDKEFRRDA